MNPIIKSQRYFMALSMALFLLPLTLAAQEDSTAVSPVVNNEPVKATFEHVMLINNHTVETPYGKSLDVGIQHRFGVIKNRKDLFGLYAPSNIRLVVNYGITDKLMVGIGATKNKSLYDLQGKYKILTQKKSGMPVSLVYYGNVTMSDLDDKNFLDQNKETKFMNRLSYFNHLMVARKFNNNLSLQLGGTYAYFNLVDSASSFDQHGFIGVSFAGRYKFSPQSAVIAEFDLPLLSPDKNAPKPTFGLGMEVSTGGHQFQIFITNANAIATQEFRAYNQNGFDQVLLGFNITRQWGF